MASPPLTPSRQTIEPILPFAVAALDEPDKLDTNDAMPNNNDWSGITILDGDESEGSSIEILDGDETKVSSVESLDEDSEGSCVEIIDGPDDINTEICETEMEKFSRMLRDAQKRAIEEEKKKGNKDL